MASPVIAKSSVRGGANRTSAVLADRSSASSACGSTGIILANPTTMAMRSGCGGSGRSAGASRLNDGRGRSAARLLRAAGARKTRSCSSGSSGAVSSRGGGTTPGDRRPCGRRQPSRARPNRAGPPGREFASDPSPTAGMRTSHRSAVDGRHAGASTAAGRCTRSDMTHRARPTARTGGKRAPAREGASQKHALNICSAHHERHSQPHPNPAQSLRHRPRGRALRRRRCDDALRRRCRGRDRGGGPELRTGPARRRARQAPGATGRPHAARAARARVCACLCRGERVAHGSPRRDRPAPPRATCADRGRAPRPLFRSAAGAPPAGAAAQAPARRARCARCARHGRRPTRWRSTRPANDASNE